MNPIKAGQRQVKIMQDMGLVPTTEDILRGVPGDGKERIAPKKEQIEKDILRKFPFDVPFYTSGQVQKLLHETKDGIWKNGLEMDEERARAALSRSLVARRAAVQWWLWKWYKEMRGKGVEIDIEILELRVRMQY